MNRPGPDFAGRPPVQPAGGRSPGSRSPGGRALRALSGVLAGGLAVLAVVLLAGYVLAKLQQAPGPGVGLLVGHGLAAVVAVILAVVADRRPDPPGSIAAAAAILLAAVVLAVYWWA